VTPPEHPGRRVAQVGVGVAVSVGLIWFAFRNTPFRDVWSHITALHWLPMAAAVVVATVPFVLRVPRWALLLRRDDGRRLATGSLWHAIAIGFAANNTLPLRLGEIVRMGAITRLGPVSFASAFASVAVERVLDALTAALLLAAALVTLRLPEGSEWAAKVTVVGVIAVVALIAAGLVARWPRLATRPVEVILPSGRVRTMLVAVIHRLVDGLAALRDPRRAPAIVVWSLLIWLLNAASFWLAFRAFDIPVGFAGAILLQGALLVGIGLPSSPGYAGVFDVTIMLTLGSIFGVPRDVGLAYAIAYHVLTFVPITLLGVYSLLTTGLTLRGVREAAQ
jgi:uncharacterized protein (TIRG00374 family)